MPDLESRNHFYLGREHDLAAGETSDRPLLYKSKDLTTHAVCVGMTGSGKTGLCLSLLEEAALDGVPAICIDPKGDLGNLLLGFPELKPDDFKPWVDESVAERKGLTPDQFAQQTAELWKNGLASWDEGPERIQKYNDSVERLIFTPGASHGLPMTVLKSFDAPPKALREDNDAFLQRVSSAVSALLALLDIDADPVRSREHIFLSNVLKHEWNAGKDLSIADLIRNIQHPPFKTVGVLDLETFYAEKDRTKLAMDLNNLLASPSFAGWMTGQPLNVQELYYSPPDSEGRVKPRLSIISIAHLSDSERMFFVTILLNEIVAWMRTQPGTGSLRSLLYMDEVFGYFPPTKNPPSKEPMLTLLKQARAFGLGCVLATQNPVDLDYKGLSNAGTWFLGRLQTERDKMRVMEGLEGASAQAGSAFDKQAMERTLAGVGSRVFLMNNVHEDEHRVFHTRWAMSYLAGPLSRGQIQKLMDPVREKFAPPEPQAEEEPESKAEEPQPQEEEPTPKDEPAPKPAVERDPALLQKSQAAQLELKERESELFWSTLTIPGFIPDLGYRVWDLLQAHQNKKATTRRTSSVNAAVGRAGDRFKKPFKAWGMWKEAFAEHQERKAKLTGDLIKAPPWLPMSAWVAIVVNVVLLLVVVWLIMSLLGQLQGATDQLTKSDALRETPAPE
ncbi:AAA-like domain protein [Planctomycetes bacterium MalM25]|nr:AAA-like domain protein [Planctomycetes bacterium MalM25]